MKTPVTRRRFLGLVLGGITGSLLGGCGAAEEAGRGAAVAESPSPDSAAPAAQPTAEPVTTAAPTAEPTATTPDPTAAPTATVLAATTGVLLARPAARRQESEITRGIKPVGLLTERDTLLYVPANYTPEQPAAFVLLFHGAGGMAEHGLSILQGLADQHNLLLMAPASRRQTWDMIRGGYGPDVTLIDRAIEHVFTHYAVDPARLAVGGFSDGASYALSLGVANGDLFTYIMAFSPGYMAPTRQAGKPRIFISHGTRDDVLPIDACSRKIVPRLESANYEVRYREFDGPHTVPPEMTEEAVAWLNGEQG